MRLALSKRLSLMLMTLILLLTSALGIRSLKTNTLWYDEWWSVYNAGGAFYGYRSPADIFVQVAQAEFHPPGYFVLLSYWGALVGWSELAIRALSLFAGILAVAVTYRLGSDLLSRQAGLYGALSLGLSGFYLLYLHEARMYALVALLTVLALWIYWGLLRGKPTPLRLFVLYASLVALLYTHYVAGVLAITVGIYHLIFAPKDRRWLPVLLVIIVAGLTFLPWLGVAFGEATAVSADKSRQFQSEDALTATSSLFYLFSNGSVALLAIFGFYGLAQRKPSIRLIWLIGVIALTLTLLANERFHFIDNTRYLLGFFPLLALIVGFGAVRFKLAPVAMCIWVAAGVWLTFNPAYFQAAWITVLPWDHLARDLRPIAQPGDKLIFLNPDGTPAWINEPVADYYLHNVPVQPYLLESLPDKTPDEYDSQLQGFVGTSSPFWIAFDPQHRHSVSAENAVNRFVRDKLACEPAEHTPDVTLQLYASAANVPMNYHFGSGITLGEIQPLPTQIASNLRLLLLVSDDSSVDRSQYSVALHVENQAGQLVGQTDFGLPNGCYAAEIASLSPGGTYHALLTVYRWQTGERLPGTNVVSGEQGERLSLGQFKVTG